MGVTTKEVLERLEQSGRTGLTERRLTEFRERQLLPPLQRFTQPGSRWPLYLWDEQVVDHVAYLYDVLQWDRQYDRLYFPLWLEGHNIPLRAVRRLQFRFIDRHLSQLTQGKTDPDEILDYVSTLIAETLLPKWKYSPKKSPAILTFGVGAWSSLVECVFGFLALPVYEPDPEFLVDILWQLAQGQEKNKELSDILSNEEKATQLLQFCQKVMKRLSPLLSIPQLKEAVEQATPEEWEQARLYYQELRHMADFFLQGFPEAQKDLSEKTYYKFRMNAALYLLPAFLSLLRHGYHAFLEKGKYFLQAFMELLRQLGWTLKSPQEVFSLMLE